MEMKSIQRSAKYWCLTFRRWPLCILWCEWVIDTACTCTYTCICSYCLLCSRSTHFNVLYVHVWKLPSFARVRGTQPNDYAASIDTILPCLLVSPGTLWTRQQVYKSRPYCRTFHSLKSFSMSLNLLYSGKFGKGSNLAIWQSITKPPIYTGA